MLHKSNYRCRVPGTSSFSEIYENIAINHIMPEVNSLHYTFNSLLQTVGYGSNFHHGDVIGPKANEFGEITQNNSHYAVQGHPQC